MCGGNLEVEKGQTICVCEYCGTKQTLPKLDDEKRAQLYDRANYFRRQNEFDKAMGIYEMILSEDKEDSECYWSIVLCRYGIEYVEDQGSHKRIPTVNRAQYTSIFDDKDYNNAIRFADSQQKEIYEAEAKQIDNIQRGILDISSKESPFDVFICYKETDSNGNRTKDSVYAQDIYSALTKEGYKVFFSRITLEDKLGSAYEPYIFAALNSAKVMLVIGTSKENFNAVWVRNEWSRFLSFVRTDSSKVIIPCYKNISPCDMPEEFAYLQSQDMNKIGYIQDIVHGIEKYIKKESVKETIVINGSNSTNASPLLKRALIFLGDGDWKTADEYCEKVLDIEPENAKAYLVKLLTELKIKKVENLKKSTIIIENMPNYEKALRFGDEKFRNELISISEQIKENVYRDAVALMECAKYEKASKMFVKIPGYKDSRLLTEECHMELQKIYQSKENLKSLKGMLSRKTVELKKLESAVSSAENKLLSIKNMSNEISRSERKSVILLKSLAIFNLCWSIFWLICIIIAAFVPTEDESVAVTIAVIIYGYQLCSLIPSILKIIGWYQLKKIGCLNKIFSRAALCFFFPIVSSVVALLDIKKAKQDISGIKEKKKQNDIEELYNKKNSAQNLVEKLSCEIAAINEKIKQNEQYLIGIAEKSGDDPEEKLEKIKELLSALLAIYHEKTIQI